MLALKASPTTTHVCAHCGDDCPDNSIRSRQKVFCCVGCRSVYELLESRGMCAYYAIDSKPGTKQKIHGANYSYLDNPDIHASIIDYADDTRTQITFYLPAIHCASCLWLLERLYKFNDAILQTRVDFLNRACRIDFDHQRLQLSEVAGLLAAIGYPPEIRMADIHKKRKHAINKELLIKLGLAGFAFGNIMLFSFPEYVGLERGFDSEYALLFNYISLMLALPVLFYSAAEYYRSAWQGIIMRHLNIDIPLVLALSALFFRSVYEILTGIGSGYLDSFTGLTFLLLIGRWMQQRTWQELSFDRDYRSYFPIAAQKVTAAGEVSTPLHQLKPGDTVRIKHGEIVPADGRLVHGVGRLDYSFVTGEARPVRIGAGDKVFAGAIQTGGSIDIELTQIPSQSRLTELWDENRTAAHKQAQEKLTSLADQAGLVFSWIILIAGTGSFLYWGLLHNSWAVGLNAFTAVMIVACPCTIALSIPFTLGNVMRHYGLHGFYIRNSRIIEMLARIDTVVFDKTGTLTTTGNKLTYTGTPLSRQQIALVASLTSQSSHPLSRRIFEEYTHAESLPVENFEEHCGHGIEGTIAGQYVRIGSATFTSAPDTPQADVHVSINHKWVGCYKTESLLRPHLKLMFDQLHAVLNDFVGGPQVGGQNNTIVYKLWRRLRRVLQGFAKLRASAPHGASHPHLTVRPFHPLPQAQHPAADHSPRLWLLSGDRDIERPIFEQFFSTLAMKFRCTPRDKEEFIRALDGHTLMLGDGLNDAAALQAALVGVVVTDNRNNFAPASDGMLVADQLHQLPRFIELARSAVRIVRQSYAVSFFYNIIGLSYAMSGQLSPLIAAILMPVSSIFVVLYGTTMSNRAARVLKKTH